MATNDDQVPMAPWATVNTIQSTDENVCKYVFENATAVAEAVLYKYPTFAHRTVICCSTQSGCPVGCRFCGAGDRFVRSLTADEIVSQVKRLLDDVEAREGTKPEDMGRLQLMFMSMGEPMLNQGGLFEALRRLYALYPKAALLISTSGPRVDYGPLEEISKEIQTIGLQFSVHESTDAARDVLIPFKAKLTLGEIGDVGTLWNMGTGRMPFFNYCAHAGNTTEQDADRLRSLFDPAVWQCTISVVCERDESVARAMERQQELAEGFERLMMNRGFMTRTFNPAGQDDVGGGCGQLWRVQDWFKANPGLARPTIGSKFPIRHSPSQEASQ